MNITLLCTDPAHPVNAWLARWISRHRLDHHITLARHTDEVRGGDLLFLVSCHQMVRQPLRDLFGHTLVLHASALPQGRGMSPQVWQILGGADRLTMTLLDAVDALDEGDIWHQVEIGFDGTELHDEIHARLFDAELRLMDWAVSNLASNRPLPQPKGPASRYRKRTPEDSRIDPARPLTESFDLLRIADPERYPAFFVHRGQRYRLRIDKL